MARGEPISHLDDFQEFLRRQTEAEEAFANGDPEPRFELWSRCDPVTLFAAAGWSVAGWDVIEPIFRWTAARFSGATDFRYDVDVADVSGDLGYTVGYERWTGSIGGRPREQVTIRVTHAYRREDGEWKIVHRHGDSPPESPSLGD